MRKQKKFEFIGLRVEEDLKLRLEILATETGVTLSELIRMTLSKEVKKAA
jgi:antitoxin component of RelBE/YafQ-DinJ toxin-antitoxin module